MKGWSFGALIKALKSAAFLDVGSVANTVAAGDDSRIVGSMQKSSNLSDVTDVNTARNSLALGTTSAVTFGSVTSTGVVRGGSSTLYDDAVVIRGQGTTNKHLYFTDSAGTELGLVYVSPAGDGTMSLRVRGGPALTIDANGNATIGGVASIQNNANIVGTAYVGGLVSSGAVDGNYGTITSNFGVQGTLTAGLVNSGDGNFSGNMAVTKTLTANKVATPYVEATNQYITGTATINGLTVQTNAGITGTLSANKVTTPYVEATNQLITGSATINGLTVQANAGITGTLNANKVTTPYVEATNILATSKITSNDLIECNRLGVNSSMSVGTTLTAGTVQATGLIVAGPGWYGSNAQVTAGTQASIETNGDIGGLLWGNGGVKGFLSTFLNNMKPTSDGATYWRDPVTGITVQWGRLQSATKNTPTAYTMPRAFNSRLLAVFANIGVNWSENQWIYVEPNGNSNTSFMYKCTDVGVGFGWLAIGI